MPNNPKDNLLNEQSSIDKLRWIMAKLRDPETGCPWDIQQTFKSIVSHTIEEECKLSRVNIIEV
jgi:uncharacterized protein YabN with tetrapyrrole methylase and pyrophosphatase domain